MRAREYTNFQNGALLIARVIVAAIFFYAAYGKLFVWSGVPEGMMPAWLVPVTKLLFIVEPLGALAVLVGFLTRWAAVGLSIIMVGAIFVSQFVMGIGFAPYDSPGWNIALAVLGACLVLLAFGAGQWSIDSVLSKHKTKKPKRVEQT